MYITTDLLTRRRACRDQLNLFTSLFPDGVTITQALCIEHADKFDWRWAAQNLLSAPLYAEYIAKCAPLYAEYIAKRAPLVAKYNAKRASLYAEYNAKCAPLDAEYIAKHAPLYAEYNAKRAPLVAEYNAKCALLFGGLAENSRTLP